MSDQKSRSNFFRTLVTCLRPARGAKGEFSTQLFFERWFRQHGSAYYFLFKKNLRVTNVQFAELLALLQVHTTVKGQRHRMRSLQFLSFREFRAAIDGIIGESLAPRQRKQRGKYQLIARLYGSLLRNIVVVDSFHGSCAVFVPPHLEIDLRSICAESGYIHSCGLNILIRNVLKCTKREFFEAIDDHLTKHSPGRRPLFFSVFSHEDFTRNDRLGAEALRHGLDDVKIHFEKSYMGNNRLVAVVQEMRLRYKKTLRIPLPGDFRRENPEAYARDRIDRSRCLWLLVDREIAGSSMNPGDNHYYVCYEQRFANKSPYAVFDEDKPAWNAHTTMPHNLVAAMVNLTRPDWPDRRRVVISDPFVGTGTTLFEIAKFPLARGEGSDLERATPLMVRDNLEVVSADVGRLEELKEFVRRGGEVGGGGVVAGDDVRDERVRACRRAYEKALKFLAGMEIPPEVAAVSLSQKDASSLGRWTLEERLLLYVAVRALVKHGPAFQRESEDWEGAFKGEAEKLEARLNALLRLRRRSEEGLGFGGFGRCEMQGKYSRCTSIQAKWLARFGSRVVLGGVRVADATRMRRKSCDVVVTDPPYGFNTKENPESLARLYVDGVRAMVKALRRNGQLVLSLPARSFTGKKTFFFVGADTVTQQVLSAARECGKEVVNVAFAVPHPGGLFRAPFYWHSDRALRRSILHFHIRDIRR